MKYSKKDLEVVISCIVDMLENNRSVDSIGESFVNWCENGNCFEGNETEIKSRIYLMNLVGSKVDDLTNLLLGLYNELEV